jgi:nucleotide-binding universal stress UspA family protein
MIERRRRSMMKRIVVGVDGSEGAALALRWAMGLADEEGAEIIAVYALGPMEDLARGASAAVWVGLGLPHEGTWRKELRRELEQDWCAPLRAAGLPFRVHLEGGSASAGLMAVADREDADLIVVGAHGHGSFEDRVLGSVSYKLSHRAHQPVVIVPPEARRIPA